MIGAYEPNFSSQALINNIVESDFTVKNGVPVLDRLPAAMGGACLHT